MIEFNFVHADYIKPRSWSAMRMLDLLLDGSVPKGFSFHTFDDNEIMAHIMHRIGIFKSVGEARRNGWNNPIPKGFSHHIVGKTRRSIAIVNVFDGIDDPVCKYIFCRCGTHKGCGGVCPHGGIDS